MNRWIFFGLCIFNAIYSSKDFYKNTLSSRFLKKNWIDLKISVYGCFVCMAVYTCVLVPEEAREGVGSTAAQGTTDGWYLIFQNLYRAVIF